MSKLKLYLIASITVTFVAFNATNLVFSNPIADPEIGYLANKLANAVLQKNESTLVELSRPEMLHEGQLAPNTREFIFGATDTRNESSWLSVYKILHDAKKISFLIEKYYGTWNGNKHEFARVYFYDSEQIKLALPIKGRSAKFWMKKFVTCRLVKQDGNWLVAYTLFDDETNGPLAD